MRSVLFAGALLCSLTAVAGAVLPTRDDPVRNLYLIRHGEYAHTPECDEDEGCGLVALGRQQARLVAARLDAMPLTFTSLQSSTMTRARETADIIAAHFPALAVQHHRDIRECTPTTRNVSIMADLEPGEAAAADAQLERAWRRLFQPAVGAGDAHDIVVCHGNVIRWLTCRALEVDATAWQKMSIANASITVIQVRSDGSCKLIAFADSGHIPWPMTTYPGVEAEQ